MPVDWAFLAAFIGVVTALVVSPGPDTLLIFRYTLASGRAAGLATVAGVQAGLAAHTLAAAFGISVLIGGSPAALQTVAVAGAAYLAWLGAQSLRAGVLPLDRVERAVGISPGRAFRNALLTNLLNPKVILLFLALMPQFVRPTGTSSIPVQLALLGTVLIAVNAVWQTALVAGAEVIRPWLAQARVQRALSWATAVLLIGCAILLAADHLA